MKNFNLVALGVTGLLFLQTTVCAEEVSMERASNDELARAVGHYAKARSLLLAALREFDTGAKIASPNSLIDTKQWRQVVIGRAEDLERVLDPQPRVSKGGIRFNPDPRLLGQGEQGEKE